MHNLNLLLNLSLERTLLIEASAGTGKTYALSIFYLRFLLGINKKKLSRPFSVEEILVLTFSESVLQELKNRIIETIHLFLIDCMKGYSKNIIFSSLIKKISCLKSAIFLLLKAEKEINKASIFTIHGFCYRVLQNESYRSDFFLYKNFSEDEFFIQKKSCIRFWDQCSKIFSNEIFNVIQYFWKNLNNFFSTISPHLIGEPPKIYGSCTNYTKKRILDIYQKILFFIKVIKNDWLSSKEIIKKIIKNKKINKRIYNSKNISNWFDQIDEWVQNNFEHFYLPKALERFKISEINKNNFLNRTISYRFFIFIENLFKEYFLFQHVFFMFSLKEIKKYIKEEKKYTSTYSFSDLIEILDRLLLSEKFGNSLSKTIRKKFPVAMIDEFQDTDFQQYRIFRKIYWNRKDCSFILIGDPKQSIYSFRGADVFTYILIRSKLKRIYVLNVNWRSSYSINKVINYLFQSIRSPFLLKYIRYTPIYSVNRNTNLRFIISGCTQPALNIWTKLDSLIHIDEYKRIMTNFCVKKIYNLMKSIKYREAYLEKSGKRKLLCLSDIAVIVRDNYEAKLIFDALNNAKIPTVYHSKHNSVFDTLEAQEIFWILAAILFPEDKNNLRCALSTDIFGLNSSDIYKINREEFQWSQYIKKFKVYKSIWKNVGILSMIKKIMNDQIFDKKISIDRYNENKLTNILHIFEILQEFSSKNENEYALMYWLKSEISNTNKNKQKYKIRMRNNNYENSVNIMTIHKSKGLEFPLVFLPFSSSFYIKKNIIFHDKKYFFKNFDLSKNIEKLKLIRKEDFSEELRLFYVSITRSIYQCTLSAVPLLHNVEKINKDSTTGFHYSAFGYLLQGGKKGNTNFLVKQLEKLKKSCLGDVSCFEVY